MAGLGETVFGLMQRRAGSGAVAGPLRAVEPEGGNPGRLRMLAFVPAGLPPGAPLVIVLHGCTQTASGYDHGAGWSTLAARHGFALLFPEQERGNNANLCFNWFEPGAVTRGRGEVASISEMIAQMLRTHRLDPARVYVTGLSAGGAMTAAMLATYPELFAGGAVVAGLPFGAASGMPGAFEAMRGGRVRTARAWGDLVRCASPHRGPWPHVQVWHGAADTTVGSGNHDALLLQWSDVLGLEGAPEIERLGPATHRVWRRGGRAVLEGYMLDGVGHGTPLATGSSDLDASVGAAGPFMLETGIGSSARIAASWGLLTQAARPRSPIVPGAASPKPNASSVADTIKEAMRAAWIKT